MAGNLPKGWEKALVASPADPKGMATRVASGKAINNISKTLPELIGGSADLTPSTNTYILDQADFQKGNEAGRNLHFGVREHGMGAIVNGMAIHKGLIPFVQHFLFF